MAHRARLLALGRVQGVQRHAQGALARGTTASRRALLLRCIMACAKYLTVRGLATIRSTPGCPLSAKARSHPYRPVASTHALTGFPPAGQSVPQQPVSGRRVAKASQPPLRTRHDQLSRTHLAPVRLCLVHHRLLGVGCDFGSPTLRCFQLSLSMQARVAFDSPQLSETRPGTDLHSRFSRPVGPAALRRAGLSAEATRPCSWANFHLGVKIQAPRP
jgi:hypothetical protein